MDKSVYLLHTKCKRVVFKYCHLRKYYIFTLKILGYVKAEKLMVQVEILVRGPVLILQPSLHQTFLSRSLYYLDKKKTKVKKYNVKKCSVIFNSAFGQKGRNQTHCIVNYVNLLYVGCFIALLGHM